MLDSVPSRILAYVTCRVGRFFYRFCNSWPRVSDGPDLICMRRAWPRRGFLSNAVMTYPVVAWNSFLIVSSNGRESRASWFIDDVREIPHPDLPFSRISAYKRSRKSSSFLEDIILFSILAVLHFSGYFYLFLRTSLFFFKHLRFKKRSNF